MGGIKNKLSKLGNKVKNLLTNIQFLPLDGEGGRRSLPDEVTKAKGFCFNKSNPQSSCGRQLPLRDPLPPCLNRGVVPAALLFVVPRTRQRHGDSRYNNRTSIGGFDRLVRITKYTSLACLTLAILSTLVLNIISSYSHSSINTNAVDGSSNANNASALADSNTTSISLSFTNLSTGSNDPNISLTIPRGGGIATGGHTVTVQTNASRGYNVTLLADSSQLSSDSSDFTFDSASGTLALPQPLGDNQWGIAIPGQNGFDNDVSDYQTADSQILQAAKWAAVPTSGYVNDRIIMKSSSATSDAGDSQVVMYGANCVGFVLAGSYSTNVTYTATAFTQEAPDLQRFMNGNDTAYAGKTDQFILYGRNLSNIQSLWIDYNDNGVHDDNETATITDVATYEVTFTNAPSDQIGIHDVYIETLGGVDRLEQSFIIQPASICRSGDPNNDCQVDIDDNMIPVKYDDANSTLEHPIWTTMASREDSNNLGNWYDYDQQKWANAITVKEEALDKYKGKDGVEVDNDDVLGYWVYIPRYAYEVQRRDATDGVVGSGGGYYGVQHNRFIVEFETASDIKKYPAKGCSNPVYESAGGHYYDFTFSGIKDYRKECGLDRLYGDGDDTTWATHPAFTFGDEELNGIWVSKFYSVPTASDDGVLMVNKPNMFISPRMIVKGLGVGSASSLYYASKLVGQTDPHNTGGTAGVAMAENSNNLHMYTSHLAKNKDWGAIVYLASSGYGLNNMAGVEANYAVVPSEYDPIYDFGGLVAGCGGYSDDESSFLDAVLSDEVTAICSMSDMEKQYNGDKGVLSSTTHNVYGIYDFSGFIGNLVAATIVNDGAESSNQLPSELYADIYHYGGDSVLGTKPTWWPPGWNGVDFDNDYGRGIASYDTCTYDLCGGQAIHETVMIMPVAGGSSGVWPDNQHTVSSLDFPAGELAIRGFNSDGMQSLFAGGGVSFNDGVDGAFDDNITDYINGGYYSYQLLSPRIVIKPEAEN